MQYEIVGYGSRLKEWDWVNLLTCTHNLCTCNVLMDMVGMNRKIALQNTIP